MAQRRRAVAEYGLAVGDENMLDLQGGQRFKRRQVTLVPPAAAAFAVYRVVPDAQLSVAGLDDCVTEDQGAVGWDLDRLLGAGRAADRMEAGGTTDVGAAGHGFEPRGIAQPRGHLRMPIDARLGTAVAPPQRLCAAGVERLADEDPHAATGEVVKRSQRRVIVALHERVDEQCLAIDGQRVARSGAELARTQPSRAALPAPDPRHDLLHAAPGHCTSISPARRI